MYRGVAYRLHTGLFGAPTPLSWDDAYHAAGTVQEQTRTLYRTAQELTRLVGQQLPGAKTVGARLQQLAKQVLEQAAKLVLP